jgi:CheY-like chemotaxis protein
LEGPESSLCRVTGPLVLIADDDSHVRMTIELVLQDEGFRTVIAGDGEEALRLATAKLPDMILMDQSMPKMGGKQVLSHLRNDERTRLIPVLILSGRSWGSAEEWPGAQFLGKPFNSDELVARIRQALKPVGC